MKKYFFWIKTTLVLQCITFVMHSISLIVEPQPANDKERELLALMNNYTMDMGFGFIRSMSDLMTSFSICFSLLLLFTALINGFLLRIQVDLSVWKGVLLIQMIIYALCFVAMLCLTFLQPILCIGLILGSVFISYVMLKNASGKQSS